MSNGKGNSETTKVELPPEIKKAALSNLDIADEVAAIGYSPYSGNTQAALSPQSMAGMQSFDQAASAFGMPSAVNWQAQGQGSGDSFAAPKAMSNADIYTAMTGMPPPTTDAQGFSGYSPMGQYEQAIAMMAPAQRAAIESFVMNPQTGAAPTNLSIPRPKTSFITDPKTGQVSVAAAPKPAASPQTPVMNDYEFRNYIANAGRGGGW